MKFCREMLLLLTFGLFLLPNCSPRSIVNSCVEFAGRTGTAPFEFDLKKTEKSIENLMYQAERQIPLGEHIFVGHFLDNFSAAMCTVNGSDFIPADPEVKEKACLRCIQNLRKFVELKCHHTLTGAVSTGAGSSPSCLLFWDDMSDSSDSLPPLESIKQSLSLDLIDKIRYNIEKKIPF